MPVFYWPISRDETIAVTIAHIGYVERTHICGMNNGPTRKAWAEREGIVWLRGHHADDSVEAQALLAAYALYRSVAA